MRYAITGGTGFVGRHLARALIQAGHEVVLVSRGVDRRDTSVLEMPRTTFAPIGLDDPAELAAAFSGCVGIGHCAGINRQIGRQTYKRVHVDGTANVVEAARRSGVPKIALLSFLRARPDCGSPYHESKWAAEEIVRASGLDYTVIKPGVIYGRGDHMLDHLSLAMQTFPVFATVGFKSRSIRPIAVEDVVKVLTASLVDGRLSRQTVAVMGPEELTLSETVRRVAAVIGRKPLFLPAPIWLHRVLAVALEKAMAIPLVSRAQVRILAEGIVAPLPACDDLPADLKPTTRFTREQIRLGLPEPGRFGLKDCLCWRSP